MEINKIHKGDCLDIMAQMPNEFVDCIVTDPPYFMYFIYFHHFFFLILFFSVS